jgi:hypothetical protein
MMTQYIARSSRIASRLLEGEMIVVSAEDSALFSLNEIATAIWLAADGRTPLREIVEQRVCAVYEVDPETALRDAEELVRGLCAHGILLTSDRPFPEAV